MRVVQRALHVLPQRVAVRADHHAAAHGRLVGQLRLVHHIQIPAREVVAVSEIFDEFLAFGLARHLALRLILALALALARALTLRLADLRLGCPRARLRACAIGFHGPVALRAGCALPRSCRLGVGLWRVFGVGHECCSSLLDVHTKQKPAPRVHDLRTRKGGQATRGTTSRRGRIAPSSVSHGSRRGTQWMPVVRGVVLR